MTDIGISLSRKGKPATQVAMETLREITPEDIDWLQETPVEAKTPAIKQLRHTHHLAARLLAEGRKEIEVAQITGYSISRVSIMLNHDPAFKQLVAYYKANMEMAYVNVHERLAALGIHCLEELQDRVANAPETFGNKELRELMQALMDRSVAPVKGASAVGASPTGNRVVIQFIEPEAKDPALPRPTILIEQGGE